MWPAAASVHRFSPAPQHGRRRYPHPIHKFMNRPAFRSLQQRLALAVARHSGVGEVVPVGGLAYSHGSVSSNVRSTWGEVRLRRGCRGRSRPLGYRRPAAHRGLRTPAAAGRGGRTGRTRRNVVEQGRHRRRAREAPARQTSTGPTTRASTTRSLTSMVAASPRTRSRSPRNSTVGVCCAGSAAPLICTR